jgi:anti-anti-sigma regulatory factor
MSATSTGQAHIAYELIDDANPELVVIEFLSHDVTSALHSRELGEQLESLIGTELPQHFVIDFANVRSLGSTAFGDIVSFARQVRHVSVCNLQDNLRLGASLIGLDQFVDLAANRRVAINLARKSAMRGQEDTVDYPVISYESS